MDNYKYIYGPVPSRRLGISLGISPIPKKYCNYSCIYCQLGRTDHLCNERKSFFDIEDIVNEFKSYNEKHLEYDVITIVGEGEPLLYKNLGTLIHTLKKLSNRPIAVVTNGALLSDKSVRDDLMKVDILLPSLDAHNEMMFKKINRPHPDISFENYIKGLQDFSKIFSGDIWIEIMLIDGINDKENDFYELKSILDNINYGRLFINTPIRPPAEDNVRKVSDEKIRLAIDILGGTSINKLESEGFHSNIKDDYLALKSILKRHPMNQYEISRFLCKRGIMDPHTIFYRLRLDKEIEILRYRSYFTYRIHI